MRVSTAARRHATTTWRQFRRIEPELLLSTEAAKVNPTRPRRWRPAPCPCTTREGNARRLVALMREQAQGSATRVTAGTFGRLLRVLGDAPAQNNASSWLINNHERLGLAREPVHTGGSGGYVYFAPGTTGPKAYGRKKNAVALGYYFRLYKAKYPQLIGTDAPQTYEEAIALAEY